MAGNTPNYDALCAHWLRIYRYQHLLSIAGVDRNTLMPPGGNEARAAAMAELDGLIHSLRTETGLAEQMDRAGQEALDDEARANLREIRRDWRNANALPAALIERKSLAGARCEHAWRTQRPANDWNGFLGNFREVLAVAREEAGLLSQQTGLSPYDALIDRFEPGMRTSELDRLFSDLKSWLPELIRNTVSCQKQEPLAVPTGPFANAAQRALGPQLMNLLGFDFNGGRLDESTHPFCGGVPEDVRITTRYRDDDDALQCVMGVIHETGHARYEQNLPRHWLGQPVANARSMGLHESQSLSFEMQLARSPAFVGLLSPLLQQYYGTQATFAPENLGRLLRQVKPGLIRVDADELTYPLHVILRYEIERALIEGHIEAEDIPGWWNERMRDWLGQDTRGDYRNGCLQDVHWTEGLFGYFPCYTLGAMYAAQWFAAMRRKYPDFEEQLAGGNLALLFDWLRENIWSQGSRWTTDELCRRASGETLNPAHFRAHLEARYLAGVAGLPVSR
jgi:carboxypeptidase Taq